MNFKEISDIKSVLSIHLIRDILIENEVTTYNEFQNGLLKKVEESNLSEEDKEMLRKNI